MFYECLTAEHTLRSDNVSTDSKFMKIGGSQFIVKFPDWLYSYFLYNTTANANRVTSAPRLPEPRIYILFEVFWCFNSLNDICIIFSL